MFANENAYDAAIRTSIARWEPTFGVTIPLELVKGIIARESSFDPSATRSEPDGDLSRGLMQVKGSTARYLGLDDPNRLLDPYTGIYYGVRYLGMMLKAQGGNEPAAVAAYAGGHAGSGGFTNQGYVDDVFRFADYFHSAAGSSAGGAAFGWLALAGLAAFLLFRPMYRGAQ